MLRAKPPEWRSATPREQNTATQGAWLRVGSHVARSGNPGTRPGRCEKRGGTPGKQNRSARSGDETPAEPVRNRLGAVADPELAEQPPSVGLDRVLGEVELSSDLAIALALAHAAQHLQLALGELDSGIGGCPRCGHGRARQGVRECGHQFRTRRVPTEVTLGAARWVPTRTTSTGCRENRASSSSPCATQSIRCTPGTADITRVRPSRTLRRSSQMSTVVTTIPSCSFLQPGDVSPPSSAGDRLTLTRSGPVCALHSGELRRVALVMWVT